VAQVAAKPLRRQNSNMSTSAIGSVASKQTLACFQLQRPFFGPKDRQGATKAPGIDNNSVDKRPVIGRFHRASGTGTGNGTGTGAPSSKTQWVP